MQELPRLLATFMLAAFAMTASYGLGFVTGLRVEGVPALEGLRAAMAPAPPPGLGAQASAGPDGPAAGGSAASAAAGPSPAAGGFDVFWEALRTIQDDQAGALPEADSITYGAIRGSLKALDDPYTAFYDPVVTEINRPSLDSQFDGIGAYVTSNERGQLVIQTPMRGQPAEKAGIEAGDIVIRVDGEDISDLDLNQAVLKIRGPKGTTVVLTVLRDGVDGELTIPVVRDKIDVPSVNDVRLLEAEGAPEVGYIQLTTFAEDTTAELIEALDELRGKGAKALVLDLRNNPGGYLNTAIEVTSQFIDTGIVVQQEDKAGSRRAEGARKGGHALDLPLVVLVNKGSASASEIVAGAMRDHERAVLVGETTFGKGSVQNVHELSDGSQLRVTVAAWLTPDGSHINKVGIEPNVAITFDGGVPGEDDATDPDAAARGEATPTADAGAGADAGSAGDTAPGDAGASPTEAPAERTDHQLLRAVEEARKLVEKATP